MRKMSSRPRRAPVWKAFPLRGLCTFGLGGPPSRRDPHGFAHPTTIFAPYWSGCGRLNRRAVAGSASSGLHPRRRLQAGGESGGRLERTSATGSDGPNAYLPCASSRRLAKKRRSRSNRCMNRNVRIRDPLRPRFWCVAHHQIALKDLTPPNVTRHRLKALHVSRGSKTAMAWKHGPGYAPTIVVIEERFA